MTTHPPLPPVLLPLVGRDYVGGSELLGYFPSAEAAAAYCADKQWNEAWCAVLVRADGSEAVYDEDGRWYPI